MFAQKTWPHAVAPRPPIQREPSISPTVRSVPGPRKCSVSKPRSSSSPRRRSSASRCSRPRCDRVVVVEPARVRDLLEEAVDVGLAEDALRPRRLRPADDAPRLAQLVRRPVDQLAHLERPRAREPVLVRACEVRRREVAHHVDGGAARVVLRAAGSRAAPRSSASAPRPRRGARAGTSRSGRGRAAARRRRRRASRRPRRRARPGRLDVRVDEQLLIRLQVAADADDHVAVAVEQSSFTRAA